MITFETKIWEKDWEYILKGDYLEKNISANKFKFTKKQIIINNVDNRKLVEKYCERKINEGIIDCYYSIEDFEKEVLDYFDISKNSFNGGFYYSIAELLGIYKCQTEFLLHFSGDSYINKNNQNWIEESIKVMRNNPDIVVANPTWNNKFHEAEKGSFDEVENFFLGYGFSDQCYLIRKNDFMKKIYNEKNIESERYPKYGGELFEKRIDAYMRNNSKYRITHKNSSYISYNFPRNWFSRKILNKIIIQQRINKIEM